MPFVVVVLLVAAAFVAVCVCGDLKGVQNYNKVATTNAY